MARHEQLRLITKNGTSWAATLLSHDGLAWNVTDFIRAEAVESGPPSEIMEAAKKASGSELLVVDSGQPLLLKELAVTVVSAERQADAILHEVETSVPFAIEETRWEVVQLDEDTIEERFMLLAAREEDIDRSLLELIDMPRKEATRFETLPVAFANTVRVMSSPTVSLVSVLLGPKVSFIVFTGGSAPMVRALNFRVTVADEESAAKLKAEIMRGMAAFRRQESSWRAEAIHLYGAEAIAFEPLLTPPSGTELKAFTGDALREGSSIGGLNRVSEEHLVAVIGLSAAVGETDLGWQRSALRSSRARRVESSRISPLGWWVAALLFVGAGLLWMLPPWFSLQAVDAALREVSSEVAPLKRHASALGAIEEATEQELNRLSALTALANSRSVWNNTLVDLQSRVMAVENVWFDGLDLRFVEVQGDLESLSGSGVNPELVLKGRLLDPAHPLERVSPEMQARVNDLIERLEASRYISAVTEKRFEPLDGGLLQFTLTLNMSQNWAL